MNRGKLIIEHLPLNVFYDESIVRKRYKLPSEKRNIDIIKGITFGRFLNYIKANDEGMIKTWINEHENKLKDHLSIMQEILNELEHDKYCKNLNYILDFVIQAIDNLNVFEYAILKHEFDEKSTKILQSYKSLNCLRNLRNYNDKNLYIKKIMYDLYEDIEYMLLMEQTIRRDQCYKMVKRIKNRLEILIAIHEKSRERSIFNFDNECTLHNINKMFKDLKCTNTPKHPKSVTATKSQPLTAIQSTGRDLLESGASKDGALIADLKNPESVSTEDELEIDELEPTEENDPSEAKPNLKTTYAAASLAGVSLFGTILYKYGPFRNRFNSRRGAINGSNIFPTDNHVYDGNIMNNFEYLQTGIPNGEYQLGYGSVTDY